MRKTRATTLSLLTVLSTVAGCAELVHMGQISDQEYGRGINEVKIEQQDKDGDWRQLDKTDGNGKYWIMKDHIKSGQQVRFTKPGYYPVLMWDNQFLQEVNFQMIPSEGGDEFGNRSKSPEESDFPGGR